MKLLVFALVGGLVWVGLRGRADPATFTVGVVLSAAVARALGLPMGGRISATRIARGLIIAARLIARFTVDLAVANARQLKLILSPTLQPRPRWITYTSRLENPVSRVLLGVMISLTPGTVTAELRGSELVIHVLEASPEEDPGEVIRDRFESLLLELERR